MLNLWRDSLIHERIFGGYVLFTLLRLCFSVGAFSPHVFFYAGALVLILFGVWLARYGDATWAWRARLAIYPILMNAMFVNLRWVSPLINQGKRDAWLWEWDRLLVGGSLSVMLEPLSFPPLTEFLSFCYMFFMIYLFWALLAALLSPDPQARALYAGLFSLYGLGYLGYTLVPAEGPYAAYAQAFAGPLTGYGLTEFLMYIYPTGTNHTDVFPSLHWGVVVYLLILDRRWNPRRFHICLLPGLGLGLATIYLRFHYFADVLAGLAVAAAALYIARRSHESICPELRRAGGRKA